MLLLVSAWFLHLFMIGNLADFNDTNRYGIPTMDKEKKIEWKPFQFSCPIIRNWDICRLFPYSGNGDSGIMQLWVFAFHHDQQLRQLQWLTSISQCSCPIIARKWNLCSFWLLTLVLYWWKTIEIAKATFLWLFPDHWHASMTRPQKAALAD